MQHKINWCYLCRSTENLTSDHLPPKNLFPEPRPSNLITVPRCRICNERFSNIDEQFRVFVSTPVNVSETGKSVMRKNVFGGSLKRSPALKKQMGKDVFKGTLMTALGPMVVPLIAMDSEVLDQFFIRMTKGMLATFYRDIDYFGCEFSIRQLNQFGSQHSTFKTVTSMLISDERGNGVFRFWRWIAREERTGGIWIYQFYDASLFMVMHTSV